MLPWHQQLLVELFAAPFSIRPNFKTWELKQLSSGIVLYFLLILSMGLNIEIFEALLFLCPFFSVEKYFISSE